MSEPAPSTSEWTWLNFDQADRLRRALRVSDTTVQEMADELQVGRNTVGRYINGHARPSRATLVVWAMKTGVPAEWLDTGTPPADASGVKLPRLDSNQQPFGSPSTQVTALPARTVAAEVLPAAEGPAGLAAAVVHLDTWRRSRVVHGRGRRTA